MELKLISPVLSTQTSHTNKQQIQYKELFFLSHLRLCVSCWQDFYITSIQQSCQTQHWHIMHPVHVQPVFHFVLHLVVRFLLSSSIWNSSSVVLDFHDLDIFEDLQTSYFVECSSLCISMVFPRYWIRDLLVSNCRHITLFLFVLLLVFPLIIWLKLGLPGLRNVKLLFNL